MSILTYVYVYFFITTLNSNYKILKTFRTFILPVLQYLSISSNISKYIYLHSSIHLLIRLHVLFYRYVKCKFIKINIQIISLQYKSLFISSNQVTLVIRICVEMYNKHLTSHILYICIFVYITLVINFMLCTSQSIQIVIFFFLI